VPEAGSVGGVVMVDSAGREGWLKMDGGKVPGGFMVVDLSTDGFSDAWAALVKLGFSYGWIRELRFPFRVLFVRRGAIFEDI
jgi:hypothetical protein